MVMDVILHAVSQLAAHRIAIYAASPHLQAFPLGRRFCDEAQELGLGTSDYKGPCLVLLQNCTATPEELVQHIMGCFLRGYIVRIYWCDHLSASKSSFVCHIKDLVNVLKHKVCKSEYGPLRSTAQAIEDNSIDGGQRPCISLSVHIHDCQQKSSSPPNIPKITFRLQTFPNELSKWLIDELPELDYALHHFSHSLYAVEINGVIRYGIGRGEDMYLTACDREALFKGYVARACSKLEEALHVRGIKLMQEMVVLDVGAAPGAWTEFLSRSVHHVVAVDPGQLDNSILGEKVTHICKKAQDASQELLSWTKERRFDLLVCDINKHPVEAAEIILSLLPFLRTKGSLIMTLKFHGRGKNKIHKIVEIKDMLKDVLEEMECIWLLANSIYERTFVGVKK